MDTAIVEFFNQFAGANPAIDRLVAAVSRSTFLKGGALVALFYWAWFRSSFGSRERRLLLVTLLASPLITLVARLSQSLLPERTRPLHDEALNFTVPIGVHANTLEGWSSFPSDHAVLFFALSIGIFSAWRAAGVVALLYTSVVIALPRIYLGLHYPTDILSGLAIGGALILAANRTVPKSRAFLRLNEWSAANPGPFYATFFLISWQTATLFAESRSVAHSLIALF